MTFQNQLNEFFTLYLNGKMQQAMGYHERLVQEDKDLALHLVQYNPPQTQNAKAMKHASILVLKDYIREYYPKFFNGNQSNRAIFRQTLFTNMLQSQDVSIQRGWATCVAQVAKVDYPEQWGNFVQLLNDNIFDPKSSQSAIRGAISTLIIATEIWDPQSIHQFLQQIHTLLLKIVQNESFPPQIKFQPISLLYTILELLFFLSDEYPKEIETYITRLLKDWFPIISRLLPNPNLKELQNPNIDWSVVNALLEILSNLIFWFPKGIQTVGFGVTKIPETLWLHLIRGSELYNNVYITQGSFIPETKNPIFPGKRSSYESFLQICLDFFVRLLDIPRFAPLIDPKRSSNPGLPILLKHTLIFSQYTKQHLQLLLSNPPEFLDIIESTCVRTASFDLIQALVDSYSRDALQYFIGGPQSLAMQFFEQGPREAEAVISLVNSLAGPLTLAERVSSARKQKPQGMGSPNQNHQNTPIFNPNAFLSRIAEKCLDPRQPFLLYSTFICAQHFSEVLSPQVASKFIPPALGCLSPNNNAPWVVRYAATLCLANICQKFPPNSFKDDLFCGILSRVLDLFPVPDEAIYRVFPALNQLIEYKPHVVPQVFPQLTQVITKIWTKYAHEGTITETVEDVFQILLAHPQTQQLTISSFVPMLISVIDSYIQKAKTQNPANPIPWSSVTSAEFALESLLLFINPPSSESCSGSGVSSSTTTALDLGQFFNSVGRTIIELCLYSPHKDIYCSAATLLRDLVWVTPHAILQTHNVLVSLNSIIDRLFSPKLFVFQTQAANEIFDLLLLLSQKFPQQFRPRVSKYLGQTLLPLFSTWSIRQASDTMLSAFLPFYGHLVKHMGAKAFHDILAEITLPPYPPSTDSNHEIFTSTPQFILSIWTLQHCNIVGSYRNKLSLLGLFEYVKYIASNQNKFDFLIEGELVSVFEDVAAGSPTKHLTRSQTRNVNIDARRAIPPAIGILKTLFSEWSRTLIDRESEKARITDQAQSVARLLGESAPEADLSYIYDDDDDYFSPNLAMFDEDNLQSMLDQGMGYEEKRIPLYSSDTAVFKLDIDKELENFLGNFLRDPNNKNYMDKFILEFNPREKKAVSYFLQ